MITGIQAQFLFALQPTQKQTIKSIQPIKATSEWTWLSVTSLSYSQNHVHRLDIVGLVGDCKPISSEVSQLNVAYLHSLKLKMVDTDEDDGDMEPQESSESVTQLCLTLCDPMDYTVHGILQARILEWVDFPFSRGSSQPRVRTQVSWLHSISSKKILAKPQLHASKFYFLLCH